MKLEKPYMKNYFGCDLQVHEIAEGIDEIVDPNKIIPSFRKITSDDFWLAAFLEIEPKSAVLRFSLDFFF